MSRSAKVTRKLGLLSLSCRLRRERREEGLREIRELSAALEEIDAYIQNKEEQIRTFCSERSALTLVTSNRADLAARFDYAGSCSALEYTLSGELDALKERAQPIQLSLEHARTETSKAAKQQQRLEERALELRRFNRQALRALEEEAVEELAPLRGIQVKRLGRLVSVIGSK